MSLMPPGVKLLPDTLELSVDCLIPLADVGAFEKAALGWPHADQPHLKVVDWQYVDGDPGDPPATRRAVLVFEPAPADSKDTA